MWISAKAENFRPQNFEVYNFYGEDTCFAWQNNLLVVFPYVKSISTSKLSIVTAPREIKCIRCFGGRVFVTCKPSGVYKFMQNHKFSLLSQTGIGIGSAYHQVLSPENQWLYMKDKNKKNTYQLFPLEATSNNSYCIFDFALTSTNSEYSLRRALHQLEDGEDEDICIVSDGKKLFKITQDDTRIIYRVDQKINDIVGIMDEETIVGFVLVMAKSAVLVYLAKGKLVFDKIYLDAEVRGLCAGMNGRSNDTIWIAHIDGSQIYYSAKNIIADTFRRTGSDIRTFSTIKNYKGKVLIGMSNNNQLIECDIQSLGLGKNDAEEFYDLKQNMLEGTELLVDEICEEAKKLQKINENILGEQEKLKRINIYAHKQAIMHLPNVRVERIADKMFLRIKFDYVLPLNCHIVAVLRTKRRTSYCMKLIEDPETVVDVPVEKDDLDNSMRLRIDLVTLIEESRAWCLIKDYVIKPRVEDTSSIENDRMKFIKAKLAALEKLSAEGNLDMKKLSSIKKNIRRELQNI